MKRKRPRKDFLEDIRPMKKRLTWKEAVVAIFDEYRNQDLSFNQILEEVTCICNEKKLCATQDSDLRSLLEGKISELRRQGIIKNGNQESHFRRNIKKIPTKEDGSALDLAIIISDDEEEEDNLPPPKSQPSPPLPINPPLSPPLYIAITNLAEFQKARNRVPPLEFLKTVHKGTDCSIDQCKSKSGNEIRFLVRKIPRQNKELDDSCVRFLEQVNFGTHVLKIRRVISRKLPSPSFIFYDNFEGQASLNLGKRSTRIKLFLKEVCQGILGLVRKGIHFYASEEDVLFKLDDEDEKSLIKKVKIKILLNEKSFKFAKIVEEEDGDVEYCEFVEHTRLFVNRFLKLIGKVEISEQLSLNALVEKVFKTLQLY